MGLIEIIGHIFVFILLFTFSGAAAVLFIHQYWKQSYLHLFLGYTGAVTFATGIATAMLDFTPQASVVLAAGFTAGLTGFTAGVYILDLDFAEHLFNHDSSDTADPDTGCETAGYGDEELYLGEDEGGGGEGGAVKGTVFKD